MYLKIAPTTKANLNAPSPHYGTSHLLQTRDQYVLRVSASDAAHLAETNVTINVLDVNDEPPVFSQNSYTAGLLEMSGPGVEVSERDEEVGGVGAVGVVKNWIMLLSGKR